MSAHQSKAGKNQLFELPCALPADHPLADQEMITPAMLDAEPMITLHPDLMIFHDLMQLFEASGHRMNVRLLTRFFIPVLKFVERGLGVSVLDPISAFTYTTYAPPGKVVFRRFDPVVHLRIGLMFPTEMPPSMITIEFAERLRKRIEALNDNPDWYLNWGA